MKLDLTKVTIRIYRQDAETLRTSYPGMGYNAILRALAAKHCRQIRNKSNQSDPQVVERLTDEELEISI